MFMKKSDQYVDSFYFRYPDEERIKMDRSPFRLINSCITRLGSAEYQRENYPFTVVELVLDGTSEICIEQECFTAEPGDLYILPRLLSHSIRFYDQRHYSIKKFFVVAGNLMDHLLNAYGLYRIHHFQNIRTAEIEAVFDRINQIYSSSKEIDHDSAACQVLKLIQLLSIQVNNTNSASYTKYRIQYWIERHLNEKINLSEMCHDLGYSKSSLFRICRKEFGCTPYRLHLKHCLEAAKKIMQDSPDISLNDVAVRLGFFDSYHFARIFKRYEGITPASFRKKLQ